MERQINGDQNFMGSGISLPPPSPFQRPVTYSSNFGGVRHGFNTPPVLNAPVPDNFRYYHPLTECYETYPPTLPPMNALPSTPSDFSMLSHHRASMYHVRAPNLYPRRVHSIADDIQMTTTTPAPSRTPRRMHGLDSTSKDVRNQPQVCVCNNNFGTDGHGTPILKLATDAYNMTQPRPGIHINQLLNPAPIQSIPISLLNQNIDASPSTANQRLPTPVSMSICSTTTSSSTIRPAPFQTTEEHCYLLNTLYITCLEATASYIRSLPLTRRHRGTRTARYHPYHSPKPGKMGSSRSKKGVEKSATLMENISTICTRLWRKARHDPMAPHREEASAAREMRDLYVWGEVVARCMESDGLDDGDENGGFGSDVTVIGPGSGGNEVRVPGMKVARAAERICNWLGDEDAWETCDTIKGELRDLVEDEGVVTAEEGGGGGGSGFGSFI
ncbi:uncharacterized protein PAC_00580 [Phialocephala subalpina]|uniref:Uncharacterized protein n=1 Tax=Phialocephala subalpina TaxID=576137 RepID=A0A1L7WD59_9HELO|nr:uncharacterized protein PAC_00580 [Phialocephala subalpina]